MSTDPVSLSIAAVASGLALAIGWLQWPRPPALDGERWFKVALATLLRGRVEAAGGPIEDWERDVVRLVPYHPAGRIPERKISNPVAAALPGPALPGEQALIEALAKIDSPAHRLGFLYDEDPIGIDARLVDPAELGSDYAFDGFGPDATWDTLAAWGAGDRRFVDSLRRTVDARWVLLEGRNPTGVPSLLGAFGDELNDAVRVPFEADLARALRDVLVDPSVRIVVVAEEAAVSNVLRVLVANADLRDPLLALLSIGGVIGGRTDEEGPYGEVASRDWLAAHFTQVGLDTDVVRLTPYFAVQWLDRDCWPPGIPGLPLQASRFPEPSGEGASATIVEGVDLGPLPSDRPIPPELVARALIAVVIGWIRSRQ